MYQATSSTIPRLSPQSYCDSECEQTLSDWLGEFEKPLQVATDVKNWKLNLCDRLTYDSNWKIPVEGSSEFCHLDEVHAKTFGSDPGEPSGHG